MSNRIEGEITGYVQRGISSIAIDSAGDLIVTLTDGEVRDLGHVRGEGAEAEGVILEWNDEPTAAEKAENVAKLLSLRNRRPGTFNVWIHDREYIPASSIDMRASSRPVVKAASPLAETFCVYTIRGTTAGNYYQSKQIFPLDNFDEISPSFASMAHVSEYVDSRLGGAS